jgi:hypothetical protein
MALKDEVLQVYRDEKVRVGGNYFVLYPGQVRQRVIAKREAAAQGWFQNFFLERPSARRVREAMHELRLEHPHLVRAGSRSSHEHREPRVRAVSPA